MSIFKRTAALVCITVVACLLTAFSPNKELTVEEVFDHVSKIERFEVMEFSGAEMGFPESLGKGTMAAHPNSTPKEEIIALLDQLSPELLVYDNTDEYGGFDRIFVENGTTLLYVHVSSGAAGDTIVILFKDLNKDKISDFINSINRRWGNKNSI